MKKSEFGVIGLAVMGQNLARNVASRNIKTSVYNRTFSKTEKFLKNFRNEFLVGQESLKDFVESLALPRKIMTMVKAGPAIDMVIEQLTPLLDDGDIIIDGGNSFYKDTIRREFELAKKGLNFFGCGVSGGEEGALHGPSLMPGGSKKVWKTLQPILEAIAAKDFSGNPCVAYLGENGAGHYVKMVHNGIEYTIMEMLAEAYQIFRDGYGLSPDKISGIFSKYNEGQLGSYLTEISVQLLNQKDDLSDDFLINKILDSAGQKGTGLWTSVEGFQRGVELGSLSQAVEARVASFERVACELCREGYCTKKTIDTPDIELDEFIAITEKALLAGIILAYVDGFELLQKVSEEQKWNLNFPEICRIWQGGCIIRAKVLKDFAEMFASDCHPELVSGSPSEEIPDQARNDRPKCILAHSFIQKNTLSNLTELRTFVALATKIGVPMFSFSAALSSFETATSTRGSANFIQGLRDIFGAHTYKRIDKDGTFHTDWK